MELLFAIGTFSETLSGYGFLVPWLEKKPCLEGKNPLLIKFLAMSLVILLPLIIFIIVLNITGLFR